MNRSQLMARIRSRGNASTELAFMRLLRRHRVTGWRRHVRVLGVRPDFVFRKTKIAVFTDGCFWHGCFYHSNHINLRPYWRDKIDANMSRDERQRELLTDKNWKIIRIWEHDLRKGHEHVILPVIDWIKRRA